MKMWAPRREYDEYKAMMKETRERSAKLRKTKRALIAASTTVAVVAIPAVDALAKLPGPKRW